MKSVDAYPELVKLLQCCGDLRQQDVLILAGYKDMPVTECFSIAYPLFDGCLDVLPVQDVVADLALLRQSRWALACVVEPQLETKTLTRLLARLRDLHATRLLHIDAADKADQGAKNSSWSLSDSLALGFSKANYPLPAGEKKYRLFEFDLSTYKRAPDWLNARHWANPELWDKHRW